MQISIESIGVLGPGLGDWQEAASILRAPAGWQWRDVSIPAPSGLPGAERRRVSQAVKVALAVAHQACAQSRFDPAGLPSIFSSSGGDGQNCHILCEALSEPDPQISPTRFTNSVHNAPSGYWSIATGCELSANSLCGYDGSFAAGLLEAALLATSDRTPVLLVAYDVPYPEPLSEVREICAPFGVAMVVTPPEHASDNQGSVEIQWQSSRPEIADLPAGLDAVRAGIPAARCLPLLQLIAAGRSGVVTLPAPGGQTLGLSFTAPGN